jgi:hypothetical protein
VVASWLSQESKPDRAPAGLWSLPVDPRRKPLRPDVIAGFILHSQGSSNMYLTTQPMHSIVRMKVCSQKPGHSELVPSTFTSSRSRSPSYKNVSHINSHISLSSFPAFQLFVILLHGSCMEMASRKASILVQASQRSACASHEPLMRQRLLFTAVPKIGPAIPPFGSRTPDQEPRSAVCLPD